MGAFAWLGAVTVKLDHSSLQQFSLISVRIFCHSQPVMRLVAEIIIIAALISLGWNKPFKEQFAQASTTITTKFTASGRSCKNTRTLLCGDTKGGFRTRGSSATLGCKARQLSTSCPP